MISFALPWTQILTCLIYGLVLGLIYLGLLWITIRSLPRIRHKGLALFLSATIRLCLFLMGAICLSQQNPARFLWIVLGFIVTRFVLLGLIKTKGAK